MTAKPTPLHTPVAIFFGAGFAFCIAMLVTSLIQGWDTYEQVRYTPRRTFSVIVKYPCYPA